MFPSTRPLFIINFFLVYFFFIAKCCLWGKMLFLGQNAVFGAKCGFWGKMWFLGQNVVFG